VILYEELLERYQKNTPVEKAADSKHLLGVKVLVADGAQ
jgi:hypothetical protein